MAFSVPSLPYAFEAMEPYIDAKTMEIHHDKHHAAYVAKLNAALDQEPSLAGSSVEDLLRNLDSVKEGVRTAVRNHGGGHANHSLFWELLAPVGSPEGGTDPKGDLLKALGKDFGSFDAFKEQFGAAAATQFGSGWAWLAVSPDKSLKVLSTANQDSPLTLGLEPILGLDVWEHAYYLKYQNRRPDYIAAFWKLVNWKKVEQLWEEA